MIGVRDLRCGASLNCATLWPNKCVLSSSGKILSNAFNSNTNQTSDALFSKLKRRRDTMDIAN